MDLVIGLIAEEPIASTGFLLTWLVVLIIASRQYVSARAERREKVVDALARAANYSCQAAVRYTKLRAQVDVRIRELRKKGLEPDELLNQIRGDLVARINSCEELDRRIEAADFPRARHQDVLEAISLRNEAEAALSVSDELSSDSGAPVQSDGERAPESVEEMRNILHAYVTNLAAAISSVSGLEGGLKPQRQYDKAVAAVVVLMAQSAGSLIYQILKHKPGDETRACFVLSRAIVESLINCCFIIADPESAERAMRHAEQKLYRDLNRESTLRKSSKTIKIPRRGIADPVLWPGLTDKLKEFTSNKKLEKNWTDLTVRGRLNVIHEKLGDDVSKHLHFAHFAVYSMSSEIIHGSFYGAASFFGFMTRRPSDHTDESVFQHVAENHWILLLSCILSVHGFLISLDKSNGVPQLAKEARELLSRVDENPLYVSVKENVEAERVSTNQSEKSDASC